MVHILTEDKITMLVQKVRKVGIHSLARHTEQPNNNKKTICDIKSTQFSFFCISGIKQRLLTI